MVGPKIQHRMGIFILMKNSLTSILIGRILITDTLTEHFSRQIMERKSDNRISIPFTLRIPMVPELE